MFSISLFRFLLPPPLLPPSPGYYEQEQGSFLWLSTLQGPQEVFSKYPAWFMNEKGKG